MFILLALVCLDDGLARIQIMDKWQEVDRIEYQRYFDVHGKLQYEQCIFWDWDSQYRRFNVVAWRLVDPVNLMEYPYRVGNEWRCSWYDKEYRTERTVTARLYRATESTIDPERWNRRVFSESRRRRLFCRPR